MKDARSHRFRSAVPSLLIPRFRSAVSSLPIPRSRSAVLSLLIPRSRSAVSTVYWKDGGVTFVFGKIESGEGLDMLKYIFAAFVVPKSRFEPVS